MLHDSPVVSGTGHCAATSLIALDPADWCWATWRRRPHLQRPATQKFERERALQALKKVKRLKSGRWQWNACEIPDGLSIAEANFWYQAITRSQQFNCVRDFVKHCETEPRMDPIQISEVQAWLEAHPEAPVQFVVPLSHVVPLVQLLDWMIDDRGRERYWLIFGFRQLILPYLNEGELEALRAHVRATWDTRKIQQRIHITGWLGLHAELRSRVESWGFEKSYAYNLWERRLEAVFGLESPELVVHHTQRLKLRLTEAKHVRAWLAHTELTALAFVAQSIAAIKNHKEVQNAVEMFEALVLVRSPMVAPFVLSLAQRSRVSQQAQKWLEHNSEQAIAGLLPLTLKNHPLSESAIAWLRMAQRQGYGDIIRDNMGDGNEFDSVKSQLFGVPKAPFRKVPTWLKQIAAAPQQGPLDWVTASDLPAIVVGDHQLSKAQHQAVLSLLQADPQNQQLAVLKQHAHPDSLNQFVWQLYERWTLKGRPGQADWVILALGRLGNDDIVLKLATLIREGCKASSQPLVALSMAALTVNASDAAVFQLIRLAYQPISKLIAPSQALDAIAKSRQLSRRQLEDQAIQQVLQSKLSKLELKQVLTLQALRFEHQMIQAETYPVADFAALALHPLLRPITQTLIWQGRDRQAQSVYFRITEDNTLADCTDSLIEFAAIVTVSLPHALEIPNRSQWADLLSDYELIPPFAQVNRPVYAADPEKPDATMVTRFADRGVFSVQLTQSLMRLGWTETYIGRGRWRGYYKPFPAEKTIAILSCTELPREYSYYHIDRVFFVSDTWERRVPTEADRIPLKAVSPLVFSEVLRELDHLTHRAKRHAC